MYSEQAIALAQKLQNMEDVLAVRFHYVLKQKFKNMVGEDGIAYVVLVRKKKTQANFIKFVSVVKREIYDNESFHDFIIEQFRNRIDNYLLKNILPGKF